VTLGEIERCKLRANALDRASTTILTLGVFAPIAASIYAPPQQMSAWWIYLLSIPCWIFGGYGLYWYAGRTLRALDE